MQSLALAVRMVIAVFIERGTFCQFFGLFGVFSFLWHLGILVIREWLFGHVCWSQIPITTITGLSFLGFLCHLRSQLSAKQNRQGLSGRYWAILGDIGREQLPVVRLICREGNAPNDDGKITYSELLKKVCKFANALKSNGKLLHDHVVAFRCYFQFTQYMTINEQSDYNVSGHLDKLDSHRDMGWQ